MNRVEKKLNALPGVTATVNLATESAHVTLEEDVADAIRRYGVDPEAVDPRLA